MKGQPTYSEMIDGWKLILRESREHDLPALLYESRAEKANISEIFQFAIDFVKFSLSEDIRIGLLCAEKNYADMRFAEIVIHKRMSVHMEVFTDVEEALAWLLKDS